MAVTTRWHLVHLPVRMEGTPCPWTWVEDVVVGWSERRVEGLLLRSRWFGGLYVAADRRVTVTGTGVELAGEDVVERRSWRWRRDFLRDPGRTLVGRAVVDARDQPLGSVKDLVIDEVNWTVTELVVSRGVVGDLLDGALAVPVWRVDQSITGCMKVAEDGQSEPGSSNEGA